MKTLKNYVEARRSRKGPASGTDEHGAYWLAVSPIEIRRSGGSGVGNDSAQVRMYLELRHYRSGRVAAVIHRDAWHQNGRRSGAGDDYCEVASLLSATTIEEVVVALKRAEFSGPDAYAGEGEPVYRDYASRALTEALQAIGMPERQAGPDEDDSYSAGYEHGQIVPANPPSREQAWSDARATGVPESELSEYVRGHMAGQAASE